MLPTVYPSCNKICGHLYCARLEVFKKSEDTKSIRRWSKPSQKVVILHAVVGRPTIAKLELSAGTLQNTIFTRNEEWKGSIVLKLTAPRYNSIHIQAWISKVNTYRFSHWEQNSCWQQLNWAVYSWEDKVLLRLCLSEFSLRQEKSLSGEESK